MTKREQEILQLERQINVLTQKLENLKKINEESIDLDESLINFSDFPWSMLFQRAAVRLEIHTVYDLIHTTRKDFLSVKGVGPVTLKEVEEWMAKHGISFLTAE